ncbi:hypothetical protein [Streptomyces sp. NBC_01803]|uniref:hypothetical protein n=1 Tax=Streptomyces sp. NBC_01803 TaxID=2975946 RepID=UPI002DDAF888|nr:hypothetical protein [Streptomyces sp. NBC_01803]WSA47130.1 hypothetical protein OIE51_24910 [Streptomyces sp. NBC_01803]
MPHTTWEETPEPTDHLPPAPGPEVGRGAPEARGCLFALSQPPLMLFLTVIGALLLLAGAHDQFLL